ncbi:hypothetical protein CRG98_009556 [Punica granatum]|uniref:Uncharacterized protein n=1 Tax=Punica granatum TaxID=22663 RepID=A0A2I0KP81_PUNGR|nr:hypothetical protein CRG98_009556 [Punica granatum]
MSHVSHHGFGASEATREHGGVRYDRASQGTKKKGKGKSKCKKAKGASKYDLGAIKPKAKVAKDDYHFYCGNTGHWKQNYKVYLEELRKKKGSETSTSDTPVYNVETKRLKLNDSNPTYI